MTHTRFISLNQTVSFSQSGATQSGIVVEHPSPNNGGLYGIQKSCNTIEYVHGLNIALKR
jgi:hypothetical protein